MIKQKYKDPETDIETDRAGMHKRPKDGMWLPMGGQLEMVTYVYPPRHREIAKEKKEKERMLEPIFPLDMRLLTYRVTQKKTYPPKC